MSAHKHAQVLRWIADGLSVQAGGGGEWKDFTPSMILALVAYPATFSGVEWEFRIHPDHQPEPLRFVGQFQEHQA